MAVFRQLPRRFVLSIGALVIMYVTYIHLWNPAKPRADIDSEFGSYGEPTLYQASEKELTIGCSVKESAEWLAVHFIPLSQRVEYG